MAFVPAALHRLTSNAPGLSVYAYHTQDLADVVEDANYINNVTDHQNLWKGDIIECVVATAVDSDGQITGTITGFKRFIVTNVIAQDAAANPGAVNLAEISGTGTVSSGA